MFPSPDGRVKLARWTPVMAGAIAFAWLWWPGADPVAALSNMDVLYHLHRVARCLESFPHVASLDTYSHAGAPWHVHWPGFHELLLATVARVLGLSSDVASLSRGLGVVPPLLGALAAAATVILARACRATEAQAVIAGLACALSGDAIVVFHHGALDHHAWTALCLPVALAAFLRRSLAVWAAALTALFLTSPEAAPTVTLLLVAAGACEAMSVAAFGHEPMPRPWAFFMTPFVACAVAWAVDRLLDPTPPPAWNLDPFRLSPFQLAWIGLFSVAGAAAAWVPARARSRGDRLLGVLGVGVGAAAVLGLGLVVSGRLDPILDRLLHPQRQQVGEEISLLRFLVMAPDTHWAAWAALLVLVALAAVSRALVVVQARSNAVALLACLAPVGGLALGLLELRHARSLAPIICVALALAIADAFAFLRPRPGASGARRIGVTLVAAWLAGIVLVPFGWHAIELRRVLRLPPRWMASVGELCSWASANLPDAGPRTARPDRATFGPWEWGHHLNVLGRSPVIVDGFNHEENTNDASWACWLATDADQFADEALRAGATHVVFTHAPGNILGLLQRTPFEAARRDASAPGGVLYFPALRQHAAFRLDERGGLADEAGRLLPLWASAERRPLAVLDGEVVRVTQVPSARLFEIVPGARLTGVAPAGASHVEMTLHLRSDAGHAWTLRQRVAVDASGTFTARTAVPAPWRAGAVVVEGPCVLRAGEHELLAIIGVDDIRAGRTVVVSGGAFVDGER